jgi:hypothetical protein
MSELQRVLDKLESHLTENVHHSTIEVFEQLKELCSTLTVPTFKFAIGQEVWFLKNDKVQKGNVRVRQITESSEKLDAEMDYFRRNTQSKRIVIYSLRGYNDVNAAWQLEEGWLFASKQELLESL